MLRLFACLLSYHHPDRRRVWDDGRNRRAKCLGCRKPMLEDHQGWRLFTSADHHPGRAAHPRSRSPH